MSLPAGRTVEPPRAEPVVLWYVESGRLAVCAHSSRPTPAGRTWSAGPGAALTPADFHARLGQRVMAEEDSVCRTLTAAGLLRLRTAVPAAAAFLERSPLDGAETVDRPEGA
jgi:glutaminase